MADVASMMQIHEILSTGRFSKLEHLKNDNKVLVYNYVHDSNCNNNHTSVDIINL